MHTNEICLAFYTCEWKMRWGYDSIVIIRKYPNLFSSLYNDKTNHIILRWYQFMDQNLVKVPYGYDFLIMMIWLSQVEN